MITHQRSGRCCSDDFGQALAYALTDDDYFFLTDDTGVFTDTDNFIDDIGECTNVSIGYQNEHTDRETLDLTYLFWLRDKCITLDWAALPTVRKPGEVDPDAYKRYMTRRTTPSWGAGWWGYTDDYDPALPLYPTTTADRPVVEPMTIEEIMTELYMARTSYEAQELLEEYDNDTLVAIAMELLYGTT